MKCTEQGTKKQIGQKGPDAFTDREHFQKIKIKMNVLNKEQKNILAKGTRCIYRPRAFSENENKKNQKTQTQKTPPPKKTTTKRSKQKNKKKHKTKNNEKQKKNKKNETKQNQTN